MNTVVTLVGPVSVRDILRQYVRDHSAGDMLDYVTAEQVTGVYMSAGEAGRIGRKALRDAARIEGKEYVVVPKTGIRLLDGDTAGLVIKNDVERLAQHAARTGARATRIVAKHGTDMPTAALQMANKQISFLNAIKISVANAAKDRGVKLLK